MAVFRLSNNFVTIYSKDGGRFVTMESNGAKLSYREDMYEHLEGNTKEECEKELQKKSKYSWIDNLDDEEEDSGWKHKPKIITGGI